MDKTQFWRLIEEAKAKSGGVCEKQTEILQRTLVKLSPDEIAVFDFIFFQMIVSAYRWDLWGAAYLINGGCSDDGFEYFCRWLISQGQAIFEAALANPDDLADLIQQDIEWGDGQLECEDIGYAAVEAYQKRTGNELEDPRPAYPSEPVGVKWEEEDLNTLFPRICEKIGC